MFKRSRMLWKQVMLYSLVFFGLIVGLVYLIYSNLEDISKRYISLSQHSYNGTMMLRTDTLLDPMMNTTNQVSHDTEVISIMQEIYEAEPQDGNYFSEELSDRVNLSGILKRHNPSAKPFHRISVYNTKGDYVYDGADSVTMELGSMATQNQILINRLEAPTEREAIIIYPVVDPYVASDGVLCISMIQPICDPDTLVRYGYVEIQLAVSVLTEMLDEIEPEMSELFIFTEFDEAHAHPLYPVDGTYPEDDSIYYKTGYRSEYGLDIILLRDRDTLMADFYPMFGYLGLGVAALYVLLLVCIYLVATYTNKPIMKLNEKVKEVTLDHIPEGTVTTDANDEVQALEQSFDLMVQRLNTSFRLEKKAYLNALQAQMNPHFLYNCLSTIAGMCIVGRTQHIPDFCSCLADILRYESTYEDKPVTLEDELKNVKDYLELMKLRYEHDFTYALNVDQRLLAMQVPRLVLQPIVENCFDHGFRNMAPPWHISLHLRLEQDCWVMSVADNGCGFPEEQRQQLDARLEELGDSYGDLQIGGMGLANTILRLRLLTEDRIAYSITPNEPRGTVVTLKGAWRDEGSDR